MEINAYLSHRKEGPGDDCMKDWGETSGVQKRKKWMLRVEKAVAITLMAVWSDGGIWGSMCTRHASLLLLPLIFDRWATQADVM